MTAIACSKCSHWSNGQRVQVRHDSVAAVRACQAAPVAPIVIPDRTAELHASRAAERAALAVPAGRYAIRDAVDHDKINFYVVDYGAEGTKWAGFLFLSAQASDNTFPIRNKINKREILSKIAQDADAARLLFAQEIGQCMRCGRKLTSKWRNVGIGPECSKKG